MFGQTWNNDTIRRYNIYFGTIFSEVYLTRDDLDNVTKQTMKVPLTYGPKEKFLARAEGNPDLEKPIAMSLPHMSFEITNIVYDPSRKLGTTGKICIKNPNNPSQEMYTYNPVPYNISISLYIMVKNYIDGTRILEQILPYFTPDWTATVNILPELGIKRDTPIVLNNVALQDNYEGNFIDRRILIWTLTFTLKGEFFGPVKKAELITKAEANIKKYVESTNYSEISVVPGLTSNGEPTTNSELTIDRNLISPDSDYDYIVKILENE